MSSSKKSSSRSGVSTIRLAVLFGYNGSNYRGFERLNNAATIEGELLNALAKLTGQDDPSKKVTSAHIPSVEELNEVLPSAIRVFAVKRFDEGFSARRSCDARTYEYLIPTYAFSTPPPQTGYAHPFQPDMTREELDALYPDPAAGPTGRLFTTLKRNKRKSGVPTGSRSVGYLASSPGEEPLPSPPASPRDDGTQYPASPGQGGVLSKFMTTVRRRDNHGDASAIGASTSNLFFGGNNSSGSSSSATRRRSQLPRSRSLPAPMHRTSEDSETAHQQLLVDDHDPNEESLNAVRRRHQSPVRANPVATTFNDPRFGIGTFRRRDPFIDDAEDEDNPAPAYYDPLDLPLPTEEMLSVKRNYRISGNEMKMLKYILGMYRGTHNFHNFIPNAEHDDKRCYIRILNIEPSAVKQCSDPEIHFGMEWIRIKVQSKAFARFQIRRMIALAILVIRTNTPRNAVSNSFGVQSMSIPEAPATALIFDEPFYMEYNKAVPDKASRVSFKDSREAVEEFRQQAIHNAIYRSEEEYMHFDAWLRSIDRYAFLYHHYLNPRGIVLPQSSFVRTGNEDDDDAILRAKPEAMPK
ncbi:tRNA pseudouridine synthase 1 [Phlyctochytrium bullatum]|nr:tRNA pseudouridine synthase 1 [Phlyctochytrium bullatum]